NAVIKNMFRVRYDYAIDFNRPDRAEFFFAAWREIAFHTHGVLDETRAFRANRGVGLDPNVTHLDFQEVSATLELAHPNRLSVFGEVPFRMIQIRGRFIDNDEFGSFDEPSRLTDPHENNEDSQTTGGNLSDVVLGLKYALVAQPDCALTFQL